MNHCILWGNIEACLDSRWTRWRERVISFGQVGAVKRRSCGEAWSDHKVFEALLLAVLSNNTLWSRVEKVTDQLPDLFDGFSLKAYKNHSDGEIENSFVNWFKERKAGTRELRRSLRNLRRAARILSSYSDRHGMADGYFTSLVRECDGDPKQAALCLGGQGPFDYKLPSLGVPLAAEALKNLGFDVAKPDRHMKRAVGSFGLVRFKRWDRALGRGYPEARSTEELLAVMTAVEQIAAAAKETVVFVDNAIWLLCAEDGAKYGLHLTNEQLAQIASEAKSPK